jgi:hypothetical protein
MFATACDFGWRENSNILIQFPDNSCNLALLIGN